MSNASELRDKVQAVISQGLAAQGLLHQFYNETQGMFGQLFEATEGAITADVDKAMQIYMGLPDQVSALEGLMAEAGMALQNYLHRLAS
ncbi:hypothetical protein [Amycolatopsis sp. Poz14]|uniref:hypothetical protein n=1 Tax=Amycolatopsis sp. Poz14 TaxID=1447705 RepID=UPI001EE88E5F|nr:hypothetical protein [Amycolatopsis sp. Poz14]MCG3748896.1 hypothetical protein [Amycolatopsis sp. Poz14]